MMRTDASNSASDVISQMRLPLMVLVVYAHSYGAVSADYDILSSSWNACEVAKLVVSQTLAKVAVPVFFMMSGYLFFCNVKEWTMEVYRGKMLRRVRTLLLPYVVWNLLMMFKLQKFDWSAFWVFWRQAGVQVDWLGNLQLMTAPANMPLWFLRDLMVVSFFTPILYIWVRRLGLWLLGALAVFYLSGVCAFVPGLSAYAVCFFTLGAYIGIRRLDFIGTMKRFEWPAYALSVVLALAMMLCHRSPVFSSVMLCFRLTGAVATINLASRLLSATDHRLPPVVCASSYFVYLAHFILFFSFVDTALIWLTGDTGTIHYLASPLVKVALLVSIYTVYYLFIARNLENVLTVCKKICNFANRNNQVDESTK